MDVGPWGWERGERGADTFRRAGAELGRERLMLVGAPGGLRCSETLGFARVWWGASQMPPASPALFLPARLYQKAAMTIFSAFLKLFFFSKLSWTMPRGHCDVSHTTFPLTLSSTSGQVTALGCSPLFWGEFWRFLDTWKKIPREAPVASGINFCFTVACKLAGSHTLAYWSTDKLPRTSKGLLNQTAMNFCRNVMHSMCLRGWRRAGVV